jgi:hypothetical protein
VIETEDDLRMYNRPETPPRRSYRNPAEMLQDILDSRSREAAASRYARIAAVQGLY